MILDEIHAVVGTKRGAHLITAVERLVRLSGEFQRIALSATVRAARAGRAAGSAASRFMARATWRRTGARPVGDRRSTTPKRYHLEVTFRRRCRGSAGSGRGRRVVMAGLPSSGGCSPATARRWSSPTAAGWSRRSPAWSTRNSRDEVAYSHHGSLSREVRAVVEERLKDGELRGIVATSSLELGIDIGALDEVVLVQTPPSRRLGGPAHRPRRPLGRGDEPRQLPAAPRRATCSRPPWWRGPCSTARSRPVPPVAGALDVLAQVDRLDDRRGDVARGRAVRAVRCADAYRNLAAAPVRPGAGDARRPLRGRPRAAS